jgi:hypothetical protein
VFCCLVVCVCCICCFGVVGSGFVVLCGVLCVYDGCLCGWCCVCMLVLVVFVLIVDVIG